MPLAIRYSKDAAKFLKKLGGKQKRQVGEKIVALSEDPQPQDSRLYKGQQGWWRNDQGEYRIVYQFSVTELEIILVGKRNDDEVYKATKRKKRPVAKRVSAVKPARPRRATARRKPARRRKR